MREKVESISDARNSEKAIKQRLENIPQDLKKRIDERDNDAIINFIESESSNINENFMVAVLQLTIQNDPETLGSILTWGEKIGLTPATGEDDRQEKHNPILVSCQQDFKICMEHLYKHGYRMEDINNTDKEEDQVKKFLIFKAASNIHYLSLEFTEYIALQNKENTPELTTEKVMHLKKLDPFQRVYKMMKDADDNMEDFQGSSELKCNYLVIKKELEGFLIGILTQCKNMNEVKTILDHPDGDDDDELNVSGTNWQVALYKGHKHLVSQPNFQQFIWRKMTGDGSVNTQIPFESLTEKIPNMGPITKFGIKRALWKLKNIPLTILSFIFCYTVVVISDLFRKGDIMFVTPNAMKERESKKRNKDIEKQTANVNREGCLSRWFGFFRKRMHIPMFRMIPYFSIQVAYLILLCLSIWNPVDPVKANFRDTNNLFATLIMNTTFIFAINFLVDDIINLFRPQHLQSSWSLLSLISHLLLVGGAVIATISYHLEHKASGISLADISGNNAINVGMTLLSFGAGMEFFRILRWLVLLETTGPIVLCVLRVMEDALRMVSIYVILFVAHGIAFWSLYKPFRPDPRYHNLNGTTKYALAESANALKSQRGLISTLFWRIIASAGPEMVNIKNNNDPEVDFSMEFSHLMGLVLWGIYQIIIYVLMLNLLIAVLNTSYSELWQNVQMEWKYNKSYFQAQFLDPLEIFPVPFRWNYYLAKAVYKYKKVNDKDAKKQDNLKYYNLVRQLILNKQEAEFETSSYVKNTDLKMDIINELKKLKSLK